MAHCDGREGLAFVRRDEERVGRIWREDEGTFRKSKGIELVATTEEGRSVLEIWRYGKSFNSEHVTHSGWITEKGLSALKAWITSMVADFPGDRELGIRAIKSRVVRSTVRGEEVQETLPNRGTLRGFVAKGEGDLAHREVWRGLVQVTALRSCLKARQRHVSSHTPQLGEGPSVLITETSPAIAVEAWRPRRSQP
uniref:Uncharacterized protein n=1 Tax=Globodera rostochiensis TaxID=31243 RepID=A0A914H4U4_GLORO